MSFQNDYRHMLDVLDNKRPRRLPIYEHIISPEIMESILEVEFAELIHQRLVRLEGALLESLEGAVELVGEPLAVGLGHSPGVLFQAAECAFGAVESAFDALDFRLVVAAEVVGGLEG